MKKCSKCKLEKDELEFYKDKTNKDGLRYWCIECVKESVNAWGKNNKTVWKNTQKIYRESTPKRRWCTYTLYHHKRNGFVVNISHDEMCKIVELINNCNICDCELDWGLGGHKKGKTLPNSPTLDRVNNEKIINKNNIMIMCFRCNKTKHDRTIEEFLEYCKMVISKETVLVKYGDYK